MNVESKRHRPKMRYIEARIRGLGVPFRVFDMRGPNAAPLQIQIEVPEEPVLFIYPTTCAFRRSGVRGLCYGDFWPHVERLADIYNARMDKEHADAIKALKAGRAKKPRGWKR